MAARRKTNVRKTTRHQDVDEIVKKCECSSFSAFQENPREHLDHLVRRYENKLPPYLKTTFSDVVIFYHKDDRNEVEELKNYIEKKSAVILYDESFISIGNKAGIGCKFCFKVPGNKKPRHVSCCCCFLYITEKFVTKSWPKLSTYTYFQEALYDDKGIVVPVLPQKKVSLGFRIPMGLSQLRPLNYYLKGDTIFESSLDSLLTEKSKMKQRMEEAQSTEQLKWIYNYLYPKEQHFDSEEDTSSSDEDILATRTQDSGFSSEETGGMYFRHNYPAGRMNLHTEFNRSSDSFHPVSSEHEDHLDLRPSTPLSMTSVTMDPTDVSVRSMSDRNVRQSLQSRQTLQSRGINSPLNSQQEHSLHTMQQVPQPQPISLPSNVFPSHFSSLSSNCNCREGPLPVNFDFNQISLNSFPSTSSRNQSNITSLQDMNSARNHCSMRRPGLNSSGSEQYSSDSSNFHSNSSWNSRPQSSVSVDMDPANYSMQSSNGHQSSMSATDSSQSGNAPSQGQNIFIINNPKFVQLGDQGVISTNDNYKQTEEEDDGRNAPVQTQRDTNLPTSSLSLDDDMARHEENCVSPTASSHYPQAKDSRTQMQQFQNTKRKVILPKRNITQSDSNVPTALLSTDKGHLEKCSSTKPQQRDSDLRYQLNFGSLKPNSDINDESTLISLGVHQKPIAKVTPMSVTFHNTCTIQDHNKDSNDLYQNHYQNDLRAPGPSFDDDQTNLKRAYTTQSSATGQDNTEEKSMLGDETVVKTVD